LLNTDWGDNGHRNFLGISLHSFAHGAAHSWNGKAVNDKQFTEKFCALFFNQKTKKLAQSMRLLGNTYITCGKTVKNKSLLYAALVEPLLTSESIDMMTEDGLNMILEQLADTRIWPNPEKQIHKFEHLALSEYVLAARMDCLACKRALVGKKLRSGQTIRKQELKKLASQMQVMSDDFKMLWLSRNKSSRLKDNLDLFKKVIQELEGLAEKMKSGFPPARE